MLKKIFCLLGALISFTSLSSHLQDGVQEIAVNSIAPVGSLLPIGYGNPLWPLIDIKPFGVSDLLGKKKPPATPAAPIPSPCIASLAARQIEGGGVGYNRGYSTVEGLFFPLRSSRYFWPFLDVRAHRFDNNEYAANAGLGFRYNAARQKVIYGFNTYFDYRTDHYHKFHFTQVGAGLEILSRPLDVRLNGYYPLKRWETLKKCVFGDFPDGAFIIRKRVEAAPEGVDFEIGRSLIHGSSSGLYGAVGTYYYGGDVCRHAWGGRYRLHLYLSPYFFIDGIVTHDPIYHVRVQGQVGFKIPLGCASKRNRMQSKLTQPIQRQEIIVLDRYCKWRTNL